MKVLSKEEEGKVAPSSLSGTDARLRKKRKIVELRRGNRETNMYVVFRSREF